MLDVYVWMIGALLALEGAKDEEPYLPVSGDR